MNSDVIQGKWKQMTGDVKKFFGKLTDDDLQQVEGNAEKLLGKLQERYGYTREQAEAEWSKFTRQQTNVYNTAENGVKGAAYDATRTADDVARDAKNTLKR